MSITKHPTVATGIYKYVGLMFKDDEYDIPMLFLFDKPVHHAIHTFFCFFNIRCIYYDEEDKVIQDVILPPWTSKHLPPRPFVKLLEIPIPTEETLVRMKEDEKYKAEKEENY